MKDNNKVFLPVAIILGVFIVLFAGLSIAVAVTGNVKIHKGEAVKEGNKEETTESVETVYDYSLSDYKSGDTNSGDSSEDESEQNSDVQSRMDDADGYIFENSDSEKISSSDLEGMTAKQLCYAYNEIFARHGHKFDADELKDYFKGKNWYKAKKKYSYKKLTNLEKKNIDTIKGYMEENDLEYKPK